MSLAKFAVLLAACAGCSVYEPTASSQSDMPESDAATPRPDVAQVMKLDGSASTETTSTFPADVNVEPGVAAPDVTIQEDSPHIAPSDASVDAGCTFQPGSRGDGSVVVEVAHWRFDENTGTTAADATGHCFTG